MLRSRPVWLAIAAFFAFALMPIFTRGAQAHILAIAAWRSILVAAIFGVWTMAQEGGPRALLPDRNTLKLGSFYGLALALASSTFVGGYAFTTVANTIFLHNLAPVMAFPLAWWMYRERLSASAMTGAAIAVLGVAMLSGVSLFQVSNYASSRFLLGDFLALLSAVGYALVLVLTRLVRQKDTPLLGTLWVAWVVAAVVLSLVGLFFGAMSISWSALLWVLGLAVICTNVPFYLLNLSMRHIPAGLASVLSLSEVVFATGVGILVYSESLAPIAWIGAGLVLIGLLYPLSTSDQDDTEVETDTERVDLSPETLQARSWRLGLALMLFNCGAGVLFLTGNTSGSVLSWAGLCMLIRLGGRPASQLLLRRYDTALLWISGGSALAIGLGLVLNREWLSASESGFVCVAALASLILDRILAAREMTHEREDQPLLHLALGALIIGQVYGFLYHPGMSWFATLAAVAIGVQAWTVLLAALRGQLTQQQLSRAPGVARLERIGAALARTGPATSVLVVTYLLGGVHIVPAGHKGIIEHLGQPEETTHPAGLVVRLPPPIDDVRLIDVESIRQVQLMDPSTPLLCQDETMVALEMNLHYKVSDAHLYAFGALDPDTTVAMLGRSALIQVVAARTQNQVLTQDLQAIEREVLQQTQAQSDARQIGIEIQSVQLLSSSVPIPVLSSFLDVASAKSDEDTLFKEAKAYEFDLLPRTEGQSATIRAEAQIEQIEQVASAEVELKIFSSLVDGISRDPELSKLRLRLERIEAALEKARLIISPESIHLWLDSSTPLQPRSISAEEAP